MMALYELVCVFILATGRVKGAIEWVRKPTDLNVTLGSDVTFPCEIRYMNQPASWLTWTKSGAVLFFNGGHVGLGLGSQMSSRYSVDYAESGRNNLRISNVQLEDEAYWNCVIFGFATIKVKLNVNVPPNPPTISINSSEPFVENSAISLTCLSAGGRPTPTIQWLRNGQPTNSAIVALLNRPMGSISSQLTVKLTRGDHRANYSCVVFNAANQNNPLIIQKMLNVQYPPISATILPVTAVNEGQSLTLTCSLSDPGYPAPEFRWWRANTQGSVIRTSPNPTFTIRPTRLADNGNYTCLAMNNIGVGAPSTVTVEVNSAPVFVGTMPSDGLLTVSITQSNVVLEHRIEGRPRPVVTWFKDSVPISSLTNLYTEITESSYNQFKYTVTIRIRFIGSFREKNRLQSDDIGNYTCVMSSAAFSTPQSRNIRLSVEFKPLIKANASVVAQLGVKTTLTCVANANPPPTFYWRQHGQLLSNISQRFQRQESTGVIAQYRLILEIQLVTAADFGQYECLVTNNKGHTTATVQLSRTSVSYYESESTTWPDVTCNLGEPQLKYHNGLFAVNETLLNDDDVWIGYIYAKVPFLLLGCASLQSENGVYVTEIGDCFTICRGGQFGIKRKTSGQPRLLCICVSGSFNTHESSCKGGDPYSLCNDCSEIYTKINLNASNVVDPGNKPEGDCLAYYYPHFQWQPCTRADNIPSMCSNAAYTDFTATALIENPRNVEWSVGNKLCLTNGRHPSFERSITNAGFGNPQQQYYWTGLFRANILIQISLKDCFSRFSTDNYVYANRERIIRLVADHNVTKRALCGTGAESMSNHTEMSKFTTDVTPSFTQSTYSEPSVFISNVLSPAVTTTDGSKSRLPTSQLCPTFAMDYSSPTRIDGIIVENDHTNSDKSPTVGVEIGVSVGILFLVGGVVAIVLLKRRGILHCTRKRGNNKPPGNETIFKENMTYGKSNEDNVANHNYFILEKCGQFISSNTEHNNESNDADVEDDYNTIHETEEPYAHVKVENCDYDHTTNALTPDSDARKTENVYNKLKIDRPGDNSHVQRHGPHVVHISEDDYDTTSAVVTRGIDDVSDYNHMPRTAYKAGATGDDIKGDKGGDYDAVNSMTFKVAQSDDSDYANVNKDRIK